jgi:hypothetical protein
MNSDAWNGFMRAVADRATHNQSYSLSFATADEVYEGVEPTSYAGTTIHFTDGENVWAVPAGDLIWLRLINY